MLRTSLRHSGAHFFNILMWTCASGHNGVHFFNILASKSAPNLLCFVHFELEICFAPQRLAILHLISPQMVPRPGHKALEKHGGSRLFYFLARLRLLSCFFRLFLFSVLLFFSSLLLSGSSHPCFSISQYCRTFDF